MMKCYSTTRKILFCCLLPIMLCIFSIPVLSQAPVISYGGYKLFTKDSAIGYIGATNRGGSVPLAIYGSTHNFAGNEIPGTADGKADKARFNRPSKIAIDQVGNLYVADEMNNLIRRVGIDGTVTTLAGSGKSGDENSNKPREASFNRPAGVCVDKLGNVYVADVFNHRIRKITSSGAVSNFAGNGRAGYVNNDKSQLAEFSFPVDVSVDEKGNIYVVDEGNNCIRKINPSGSVSTFAGSGAAGAMDSPVGVLASFNQPNGIAIDKDGWLYITDQLNHSVRKISPAGAVSTLAGNGQAGSADNAVGSMAGFNNPRGISADRAGNLYVGDVGNQKIRKITANGSVTTLAGNGATGSRDNENGLLATFFFPDGTAVDSLGNVYVADCLNNRIRKIEAVGYSISPELLLPGLNFDKATGIFSGTPTTEAVSSTYTVTAHNVFGSSSTNLTIGISPQPGNALCFDGIDDRVFIPDAPILRSPIVSVEFWVNIKSTPVHFGRFVLKRNDLGSYDDSYSIGMDSLFHFTAGICSGSGTPDGQRFAIQKTKLEINTWYYVAGVFTSDSVKLYVNGALEQSVHTGFPLYHDKSALSFGFDEKMSFELDEVRIFNTDRSVQIPADMFNIVSPSTPGLVAYYNFNTGKAGEQNRGVTTTVDLSGNENNGALTNFQLTQGNQSNWVESYAMMSPFAMNAGEITHSGFTANWSKPQFGDVDNYLLDISTDPGFDSFVTGYRNFPVTTLSQKIEGLKPGTVYYYKVRAVKKTMDGKGGASNVVRVKTAQ